MIALCLAPSAVAGLAGTAVSRLLAAEPQDFVEIELHGSPIIPDHHWRIPKAWLDACVTCLNQWKGGQQDFIVLRAGIYWSSGEIKPWPNAALSRIKVPTPDVGLTIVVKTTTESFNDHFWNSVILPNLEREPAAVNDLVQYQSKSSSHLGIGDAFTPAHRASQGTIYITCLKNGQGERTGCTGHAYLGDNIGFQYIFNAGGLARWHQIDIKIRDLLNSFRSD